MRRFVLTLTASSLACAIGCGASQRGAGEGGAGKKQACTLQGSWTITISNATDPCGVSAPGKAATLRFVTDATGAVGGATPPLRGFSMSESTADCHYMLYADKSKGAAAWAEFSLEVHEGGRINGAGHTDIAMSDGRVCTVPHTVTGTKAQ